MALENLDDLLASWDEWMVEKTSKGKLTQGGAWRRDNPGEWGKLKTYFESGGARPALGTQTGKQMVEIVDAIIEARGTATPGAVPKNIRLPLIGGTPKVGALLTCDGGDWEGTPTLAYQWYYENADGSGDVAIRAGTVGTTKTYTPVPEDVGGRNYCEVTATNDVGAAKVKSNPTAVIESVVTPPPVNTGYYWHEGLDGDRPTDGWNYEYNSSSVSFGGPAFTMQPNGEGGKCLRIGTPPNAPGGAGVLGAMYAGAGTTRSRGQKGQEYWLKFRFRFNENTRGWIYEQHEHYAGPPDIYSNGFRITPERKILVQRTGGPANQHPSSEGWHSTDTEVLTPMKWYEILHNARWSDGNDGFYRLWLNGRQLTINRGENAPTLISSGSFIDQVGLGFYSYPYGTPVGPMFTEFDYITMGPTRASVGG